MSDTVVALLLLLSSLHAFITVSGTNLRLQYSLLPLPATRDRGSVDRKSNNGEALNGEEGASVHVYNVDVAVLVLVVVEVEVATIS